MNIQNNHNSICVEVIIKNTNLLIDQIDNHATKEMIWNILKSTQDSIENKIVLRKDLHGEEIENLIESITVELPLSEKYSGSKIKEIFDNIDSCQDVTFYFYRPSRRIVEMETLECDSEEIDASYHWLLPSYSFVNLWENLIYENSLKNKILNYALSSLILSQHNVNPNIISCNRLILLHGPPGTGKTSLCKAIAQKLSIRLRSMYKVTHLIEINSHSLFSKWFSESGKLVMKLFSKIREIISHSNSLVCILMDEVESISYAREEMSGQEPKDAMRVVNALLTQLDSIKEYPNVLILATSNLVKTIDSAFLDRADIKQYIGMPSSKAISKIYLSIIHELSRVGVLEKFQDSIEIETQMDKLCNLSIGLSGRTLRKLPFLAYSLLIDSNLYSTDNISVEIFLKFMFDAVRQQNEDSKFI